MPWWAVAVAAATLTLFFGSVYFLLDLLFPSNGLTSTNSEEKISFLTCVYFSVVTESTLGDGIISPHGAARAVVSIQVLFGLVSAGILIAKVLSAPSSAAARLARMVEGDWVDCLFSGGKRVLGRTFLYTGEAGLRFRGTDYLEDGTRGSAFVSHLLSLDGDKASFTFQSFDFTKEVFASGVTTLSFSNVKEGVFTQYGIRIRDASGHTFTGQGFRIAWTGIEEQLRDPDNCTMEAMAVLASKFERIRDSLVNNDDGTTKSG